MRVNKTQQLEKLRFEQEEIQEEKERILKPVDEIVLNEYKSAKLWFDPLGNVLLRINLPSGARESLHLQDE